VNWDEVQQWIGEGDSHFEQELDRCRPTGIPDAIELAFWFYDDDSSDEDFDEVSWDEDLDSAENTWDDEAILGQTAWSDSTVRHTEPHVGHNDPCPYHPDVANDLAAATGYDDDISLHLGKRFRTSVRDRIDRITERPESFGRIPEQLRAAMVDRFPHVILFEYDRATVSILGIFHAFEPRKARNTRKGRK
jgi:hypothetical protein